MALAIVVASAESTFAWRAELSASVRVFKLSSALRTVLVTPAEATSAFYYGKRAHC